MFLQARKDATLKATKQRTVESSATVRAWKSKFLALDCLEDRARSIEQKRSEAEKIQRKEEDEYINHFTRENLEKEKAEKLKIENARNVNMQIALELKEQIGNKIEKEKVFSLTFFLLMIYYTGGKKVRSIFYTNTISSSSRG